MDPIIATGVEVLPAGTLSREAIISGAWPALVQPLVAYCLGQAYISFFRLQGPFADEHSWRVASTELFEPVVFRGLAANLYRTVPASAITFVGYEKAVQWLKRWNGERGDDDL